MPTSAAFIDFVTDQLAGLGNVSVRRMFGGAGVYCGGVMFALVADDTLYFKTDEGNRSDFDAEGLEPFVYQSKAGRNTVMSYRRAPERLFEDPDDMRGWAEKALAAARRASAQTRKKRRMS
ncbi:MAG TPA: TfoX/Sxy family protein [Hyphomicrobiaceae bacterium]|nr:TfoX/Sxy family protein [Hyphomicrobiaceae bacterium]